MPQGEDLGVLVPIAHRKKTQDRERIRHRQVDQSQQHSWSSCRDDQLAVATPHYINATKPNRFRDTKHHSSHLHGWNFRHAHRYGQVGKS
jgi:hypothetical protein